MFCQACGAEIQSGLNYCSRCGSMVSGTTAREVVQVDLTTPVRWVSATVGLTFLVGLATILIAIAGLASWGFQRDGVMFIAFFAFVTLLGVEVSLIRLLSRMLGVQKEGNWLTRMRKPAPREVVAKPQQYIQPAAAYTDPLPSVTEHTTRTFSPAYREPRAGN